MAGYGFAASLVVSGLILTPLSVGSFVASRFLIVYERRFGPRTMIPLGSVVFAAGATFFALEHSALWQAFVAVAVCGLGVGFTTGAMPGFIIRAVPQSETGSATGFYQVVRSIGLTVGSALSAAVLMAHTRHGQALPDVYGFQAALIIAAALCSSTPRPSTPGRAPSTPTPAGRVRRRAPNARSRPGRPPATPRPARTPCSRRPSPSSASRGSSGTTIREIGERAGVDAALIARYFGSKADLYIAAVAAEDAGGTAAPRGAGKAEP